MPRLSLPRWVDEHLPPCGPCAFCGCDDKRHRMTDAIWARVHIGESVDSVAADYDLPKAFVARIATQRQRMRVRRPCHD